MNEPAPAREFVASGIPAVGNVPWGTHICHVYDSMDELRHVLVPYFKTGLERGDRCVWLPGETLSEQSARELLQTEVADLDELERRGQLAISRVPAYEPGGLDADAAVRRWLDAEEEAIASGFSGLRVSGCPSPLARESWRELVDFEAAVHRAFCDRRVVVLCNYASSMIPLAELLEMLNHHGFAYVQGEGGQEIVHSATQLVDALGARDATGGDELRARRRRISSTPPRFGVRRSRTPGARRRLERLQRVALALSEVHTLDQLAAAATRDMGPALGGTHVAIAVKAPDEPELRYVAQTSALGDLEAARAAGDGHPAGDAFRGGPRWLEGEEAVARAYPCVGGVAELAALPLRVGGRVLGAAVFAFTEPRGFDAASRALLWDVAYQLALTVDRANAYEQVERQRRRAERASASKDEFLAMLGHELRNPLAAIRNASELLKLTDSAAKVGRAQAVIARQTDHMARLIDGLLDVSRIVRGKVSLAAEALDLGEVVKESIEGRADQLEAKGLALRTHIDHPGLWIRGDRVRVTQIIDNLLSNAIDFTPRGGTLTVRARCADDAAQVEVIDTGAGIRRDVLPRIFEPFQQANRDNRRSTGGLGLGLALVKGLVELHGGEVSAESDGPGKGARFDVRLPMSAPSRAHEQAAPYSPVAPRRVLIVEDHADAAEALCDVLHAAGHEAIVATDAESAIELAERFQPDAVFCDIDLPGSMNGHDVARAIRGRHAGERTLLVALSGYGRPDDIERAVEAGFSAHLTKPVALDAVNALLANQRQSESPE